MFVEAADPMQGLMATHGWGSFAIDDEGAKALEDQKLPDDVSKELVDCITKCTKTYKDAEKAFKAMTPVC